MVLARPRPIGHPWISRTSHAEKAEQALDRPQSLGGAELLQVPAPQRAGRRQSGARCEFSQAGQVSAGLSRSRADRAAVSIGGAESTGRKILRRAEFRDPRAVLLDGDAIVRAA